jgi:hypothetical protein
VGVLKENTVMLRDEAGRTLLGNYLAIDKKKQERRKVELPL